MNLPRGFMFHINNFYLPLFRQPFDMAFRTGGQPSCFKGAAPGQAIIHKTQHLLISKVVLVLAEVLRESYDEPTIAEGYHQVGRWSINQGLATHDMPSCNKLMQSSP